MNPSTATAVIRAACAPALLSAVSEFIARQNRITHPAGYFDKQRRWYPEQSEKCSCCAGIRTPSVAYPFSLMLHCRTAEHIAAKHGVDVSDLRRAARALNKQQQVAA